jgi:hydroxyacylglutathione hydrolase
MDKERTMLLRYFYDPHLAQASYLVGSVKTKEAIVIDPMRNIQPYLETAAQEDLRITHVTETHIHADFVSGSRELAAATGATIYLSDMGDANWKYAYADEPNVVTVRAGDRWLVGDIRFEVLHTPGHTPEHVSFVLTDTATTEQPMGIFTGDFLFVGDVGRPDLLESAAGIVGSKEIGAQQQFQSVQRIKTWPDYLQIWPGHGAGSACGKALGAVPTTTLGYEKLFNPAFQFEHEDEFVHWLLTDQPEMPRYFAQMKQVNKLGPTLLAQLAQPVQLGRADLDAALASGQFVVDLRPAVAFQQKHWPGTLSIPTTSRKFSTYLGWFVDYNRPLYLIMPSLAQLDAVLTALRAIGIDNIPGYFAPAIADEASASLATVDARTVADQLTRNGVTIIDVREQHEYQTEHIVGARNIPLGTLPQHLHELPPDQPIVTHCVSGYRAQIASSLLRAHGYQHVAHLTDPLAVWSQVLPTTSETPPAD